MVELRVIEKNDQTLLVRCLIDDAVLKYLSSRIPHFYSKDAFWWVDVGSKEEGIACSGFFVGL
ncbi:hypothetical protein BTJ40_12570 [Microbulbifer sp. A4B17]|nr:hypothetical protein BTJ40_12570 [Microbulbifer sp. A4B17]